MRRPEELHRHGPSPRAELASIFAAAIVRLSRRSVSTDGDSQKPNQTCLEVPRETSLNGHHG